MTWHGSAGSNRGRTTMRLSALFLAILSFTVTQATPTLAAGRSMDDKICHLVTHMPWTYKTASGNTKIKTRATETCTRTVDEIEVYLTLDRSVIDNLPGAVIEEVSSKTVNCFNNSWCRSVTAFDVPDHPHQRWIWWGDADGWVTDKGLHDHDMATSEFFYWPPA